MGSASREMVVLRKDQKGMLEMKNSVAERPRYREEKKTMNKLILPLYAPFS